MLGCWIHSCRLTTCWSMFSSMCANTFCSVGRHLAHVRLNLGLADRDGCRASACRRRRPPRRPTTAGGVPGCEQAMVNASKARDSRTPGASATPGTPGCREVGSGTAALKPCRRPEVNAVHAKMRPCLMAPLGTAKCRCAAGVVATHARCAALAGASAAGCCPACRRMSPPPPPSRPRRLAEAYVRLTLSLARHQPSLVDTWLGDAARGATARASRWR